MARTTGTMSLGDLLNQGALRVGEHLELHRRGAPPIRGVLQADGSIKVGLNVSASPSTAAKRALGAQAVDGWLRWRVPRLGHIRLEDVRKEISG
jgi:hypothetical protein